MIQRVYRQLVNAYPDARIVISTSSSQQEQILSQLGTGVDLVIEPDSRDTFPAILLACLFLHIEKGIDEKEPVFVLPVDPYADSSYYTRLKDMEELVRKEVSELVLMGITPTYPSTKYGYIVPRQDKPSTEYSLVGKFEEKPCTEKAETLIRQGALWNSGIFAFKLGFMLSFADSYLTHRQSYADVLHQYNTLPKISFDFEVAEKMTSISMVTFDGMWKDLGTWNALTEEMGSLIHGNVILTDENNNNHVINELDIPILVTGATGMIIVSSPDGILVSTKDASAEIKQHVDKITSRPMYEEKHWGSYTVLKQLSSYDGQQTLVKQLVINKDCDTGYQSHKLRSEIWTIVDGSGEVVIDEIKRTIRRGDVVNILNGQKYSVKAFVRLVIIEVQIGFDPAESDNDEETQENYLQTMKR